MSELDAGRIGRVRLRVADRDRLTAFYRDVVGLDVVSAGASVTALGAGDAAFLELRGDADAPARPPDATGLFHLAVRVPSRAALGAALDRVESEWDLDGASDHGVSEALYLRDPEGNGLELYRDRPRDAWPTDGDRLAMYTRPLDRNGVRAGTDASDGVPDGTDVGHVHLDVSDRAATRAFYTDALGMRVRQTPPDAVFLAYGDYHHHVGANTWRGRTGPPEGRGVEWVEVVASERTVAAVRDRLPDARDADPGVATADPDGIEIRITPRDAVL